MKLAIEGGTPVRTAPWPKRHLFGEEERRVVVELFDTAMETGDAIGYGGPHEAAYEGDFARFLGGGFADLVNSGTSAVYAALGGLELEPAGEVVVPPITDPGGVMPVALLNLVPVVADAAPGTFNAGAAEIEAVLTPHTRAIIVAHIAGEPADMEPILELAGSRGLPVVEDCAQSHGALYRGRPVGSLGTLGVFSTMSGKHHATGPQGGVVFTRDEELHWRCRRFADRGKPLNLEATSNVRAGLNLNGNDLAAIVMEPIRNQQPEQGFLEGVRRLADETSAPLVFDEISCGFCMNTGGAHLLLGVNPDIAVFSKALGNGYPIAAIIGKSDVMEAAQSTFISSTNWTERIGPAAALAVIEKHERCNVPDHLRRIGERVQEGWRELVEKHGLKKTEVGGIPPAALLAFPPPAPLACKALFVQLMLDRSFLASTVFHAMFAHTDAQVDAYLEAVDAVFAEMAPHIEADDVEACLRGRPAAPGFQRLT